MADIFIRSAAGPTAGENMVSADQETIIGNGTSSDPLRAGPSSSGGTFEAAFRGGDVDAAPGIPVFIAFVEEAGGITTVQVTDVRAENAGVAGEFKAVNGVVASVNDSGTVQVQASGLLTIPAGTWDAITGGSGGLLRGRAYYPSTTVGLITEVPPGGPGEYVTRFGTAIDATTMLIQPSPPVQVLGDFLFFAQATGTLDLGMAVYVQTSDGTVQPADQNISIDRAQAIGLVAAFDVNGDPIIQLGGIVELTTDQWDVVATSIPGPGLTPGHAYYVDTDASPGHITVDAPTMFAKVQVGIALTSTQMLVPGPYLQRLS